MANVAPASVSPTVAGASHRVRREPADGAQHLLAVGGDEVVHLQRAQQVLVGLLRRDAERAAAKHGAARRPELGDVLPRDAAAAARGDDGVDVRRHVVRVEEGPLGLVDEERRPRVDPRAAPAPVLRRLLGVGDGRRQLDLGVERVGEEPSARALLGVRVDRDRLLHAGRADAARAREVAAAAVTAVAGVEQPRPRGGEAHAKRAAEGRGVGRFPARAGFEAGVLLVARERVGDGRAKGRDDHRDQHRTPVGAEHARSGARGGANVAFSLRFHP